MDQHTMNGFTEEMDELIKEGFAPISFLGKGVKTIRGMAGGGLKGAAGSHTGSIAKLYGKGAAKGGWWGGVKNVAKSRYGAAGAAAGVGAAGAYGAYRGGKALLGGGQQQRQGY